MLIAIAAPLLILIFMKRLWLLARHNGIQPPSSLILAQLSTRGFKLAIGTATIFVTLGFAAMALAAAGQMISALTSGAVSGVPAIWISGGFILLYLWLGGGRTASTLSALQTGLGLLAAIAITGGVLSLAGGWDEFFRSLAGLATSADAGATTSGRGGGEYDLHFAVAGAFQGTSAALATDVPLRPWNGLGILAGIVALVTVTIGPMLNASQMTAAAPPRASLRAVWRTAFLFGLILLPFAVISGFAGPILGVKPTLPAEPGALGLLEHVTSGYVTALLLKMATNFPILTALGALGIVAALHAAIGYLLTGCVSLFSRQVSAAPSARARGGMATLALLAAGMATMDPDLATIVATLGLALSAQLIIPLIGLCWLPWLTGSGIIAGLTVGMLTAFFTDVTGSLILTLGFSVPWDAWPGSVHPALWGLLANAGVCVFVSAATQSTDDQATGDQDRRDRLRDFIDRVHDSRPRRPDLTITAWVAALAWTLFAVGPGAVIGNDLFGPPNAVQSSWFFGLPSLWTWQILMWGLGLVLLWFIGKPLGLATIDPAELEAGEGEI